MRCIKCKTITQMHPHYNHSGVPWHVCSECWHNNISDVTIMMLFTPSKFAIHEIGWEKAAEERLKEGTK